MISAEIVSREPWVLRLTGTAWAAAVVACVLLPGGARGAETLAVPVRWCAVEGSPAVTNPMGAPVNPNNGVPEPDTDSVLWRRHERASDKNFIPGAGITFRSAVTRAVRDEASFPIIPDPCPPPPAECPEECGGACPGELGDVLDWDFGMEETTLVRESCDAAWEALAEEHGDGLPLPGIPAINVRLLVDLDGNESASGRGFWVSTTGGNLCNNNPPEDYTATEGGALLVKDNQMGNFPDDTDLLVAHEMAHVLGLVGHGNGLDDDHDGPFDDGCDADEEDAPDTDSIVGRPGQTGFELPGITDFQEAQLRAVATAYPGCMCEETGEECATTGDQKGDGVFDVDDLAIDIRRVAVTENRTEGVTVFTQALVGRIGTAPVEYLAFVDLDADPTTGGEPSSLGYATAFSGAELVTRVLVNLPAPGVRGKQTAEPIPTVWRHGPGGFEERHDPGIRASVVEERELETGIAVADLVSVEVPVSVRGPAGETMRLQALAQELVPGSMAPRRDRLPDAPLSGARRYRLTPPEYPVCRLSPDPVNPGAIARVDVAGLLGGRPAKVFLGDRLVKTGIANGDGSLSLELVVPRDSEPGRRLVTVGTKGTALTADCTLEVLSRIRDCNANGVDDGLDVGSGGSPDANGNRVPDECEVVDLPCVLRGSAQGGEISTTLSGFTGACTVTVATMPGQSAADVASAIAAAINADSCMIGQGISATAAGHVVELQGFLLQLVDVTVTDPGIEHTVPIVAIPAQSRVGLAVTVLLLLAAAWPLLRGPVSS